MGVINVTPDSFSDGGKALDPARALDLAQQMEAGGADIIDIGAESTRPGAAPVDTAEEIARLRPVVNAVASRVKIPVSIDTYKADAAMVALDAGATIVNDVSAFAYDSAMGPLVASRGVPVVLMHMRGRPQDMYAHADYQDVVKEIREDLERAVERAIEYGVASASVIVDPGLGFAKRADQSVTALAGLDRLARLGYPLLVGPSRKSFMTASTGPLPPETRDWPTAAAVTAAILGGAHIVRVHAVDKMVPVVRLADALRLAAV